MKEFIILFVIFFIIIYLFYYFLYRRKKLVYDKKTLSADIKILEGYYIVNSLMLTIMVMIVYKLNKYIYKFLILLVLIVPFIWVTYYFLAKYLKHLERKSEENV